MVESRESNGLSEMIDNIKNITSEISGFFEDIINGAKEKINELFGMEVFEVQKQTKKELKSLADDILKIDDNKLEDKEISDDEKEILDKLLGNEKIKKYFERLNDNSISDEILNAEKENLLKIVKNISNNDSDNTKSDLTEKEINNLASNYESKLKVLNSVLNDKNIKNKKPDVTKKQVLEIYNKLITDNKKATKENIIKEINKSSQSDNSNESESESES